MGKYFVLQLKRLLRILPPVLLAAAVLFGCLSIVYRETRAMAEKSDQQTKFPIGLVGTAGDVYLQLGLAALESFDAARFTVDFIPMEEPEARAAMRRGELSAYLVIPEGFVSAALRGEVLPVQFVSTVGGTDLLSMMKDEITQIVEQIVVQTQKGSYGAANAAGSVGGDREKVMNDISIKYVEFVFARSKMYRVSEIGIFDGLGLDGYLISGLSVVLFLLICLSFAPMMIRRDQALARMLCAQRKPVVVQLLWDFAVYLLGLAAVAVAAVLLTGMISFEMILKGLPALLALGAMSFVLYELASDPVSGVLMQFFVILALCFVSGCMYPIAFFPETVQKIAAFLPTGLARMQLADCMRGVFSLRTTGMLLGFSALFLACAMLIRKIRVAGIRG